MRRFHIIDKRIRSNAAKAVMEVIGDDDMDVVIEKHKEDKTKEQRGWFHILIKLISDETGYNQAEVKELVKKTILGTTLVSIGGHEKEVTASSEGQDKIGYSELIDGVYQLAAEAGIQLPNPRYKE